MYLILFFLLAAFWGGSFVAIKVAVEVIDPVFGVFLRVGISMLTLAVIYAFQGRPFGVPRKMLVRSAVTGVFAMGFPFALLFWAEKTVSPGLAGIINGTVPIWTTLFSFVALRGIEKVTWKKISGLLMGLFGVLLIFLPRLSFTGSRTDFYGAFAILIMAFSYAAAIVVNKSMMSRDGVDAFGNLFIQHISSFVFLCIAMLVIEGPPDFQALAASPKALAAVCYLAIFSTAIANMVFYTLIREWGAMPASTVTYVVPIAAIGLDYMIYRHWPQRNEVAGMTLVLAAVAILQVPKSVWVRFAPTTVLLFAILLPSCNRPSPAAPYSDRFEVLVPEIRSPREVLLLDDARYAFSHAGEDGKWDVSMWTRKDGVKPILKGVEDLGGMTCDPRRAQLYLSLKDAVSIIKWKEPDTEIAHIPLPFDGPFDRIVYSLMNRKAYALRMAENEVWEIDPVKKQASKLLGAETFSSWVPSKPTYLRPSVDGQTLDLLLEQPNLVVRVKLASKHPSMLTDTASQATMVGMDYYRYHFIFIDQNGNMIGSNILTGNPGNVKPSETDLRPLHFILDMRYAVVLDQPAAGGLSRLVRFPITVKEE